MIEYCKKNFEPQRTLGSQRILILSLRFRASVADENLL
jgi:hypothetical protein